MMRLPSEYTLYHCFGLRRGWGGVVNGEGEKGGWGSQERGGEEGEEGKVGETTKTTKTGFAAFAAALILALGLTLGS